MELKKRLFSKEPLENDKRDKLVKIEDGLYECGKLTIRLRGTEPSEEGIKAFNKMYNQIILELIDKGF